MGLPMLYLLPTDDDTWRQWAFNHAAIHYTIVDAVATQKQQNLTQYQLDPMDRNDLGMWLYRHQVTHNQTNAALGLPAGLDLTSLDWNDPDQFQSWLQQNATEHQQWGAILGIG